MIVTDKLADLADLAPLVSLPGQDSARNIVNYAEENLSTFDVEPFNPVDSLILSWLSYYHFPAEMSGVHGWRGMPLSDVLKAEFFEFMLDNVYDHDSSKALLIAVATSPRFRDARVMGFTEQLDPKAEKQFAAVTFRLNRNLSYVSFRGTDASLVGWKEDFNLAFQCPVPSQESALQYLAEAARHTRGQLIVGGHSKGGNLAVYAAAFGSSRLKSRIRNVYSHDGPGFLETTLKSKEFLSISSRLRKTVPQSSLVGMLLEHQEDFRIVRSNRFSVWQHDPFSWELEGNDFRHLDDLTAGARYVNQTLNDWVRSQTPEEREVFVDALYGLIDTDNVKTFAQLSSEWKTNLPVMAQAARELDPATKLSILQTIQELARMAVKNFPDVMLGDNNKE